MSQYAYIPADRIGDVQLNYSIASPSSWTFAIGENSYGGLEEVIFSPEQRAEINSLGGQWFEDVAAFQAWQSGGSEPLAEVIRDRQFGHSMINNYLAQNKGLGLTVQQSLAQLTKFGNVKMLLDVGAIRPALTLIQSTIVDDVYTQQRKDDDIAMITEYLIL